MPVVSQMSSGLRNGALLVNETHCRPAAESPNGVGCVGRHQWVALGPVVQRRVADAGEGRPYLATVM